MTLINNKNVFVRIFRFYVDGFRNMTLGKTLWTIILIKLFIMFFVSAFFIFSVSINYLLFFILYIIFFP